MKKSSSQIAGTDFWPSISLLQKTIESRFSRLNPAFPGAFCKLVWPSQEILNVVLFGDADHALMNSAFWPRRKYRLYLLSTAFRAAMEDLYQSPGLFGTLSPLKASSRKIKSTRPEKFEYLVYSGRVSKFKNIHLLMDFFKAYQDLINPKARFFLCGPNIQEYELPEHFEEILDSLVFAGDLGQNWSKKIPAKSLILSLTTDPCDDYGVSVRQAYHNNFPLVLSGWGGHLDISGTGVWHLPPAEFPPIHEMQKRARFAADAVQYILDWPTENLKRPTDKEPVVLTAEELQNLVGRRRDRNIPLVGSKEFIADDYYEIWAKNMRLENS